LNADTLWLQVPAAKSGEKSTIFKNISIAIFFADHGVVIEENSVLPLTSTSKIISDIINNNSSIRDLVSNHDAKIEILNLGTKNKLKHTEKINNLNIGFGTANFCHEPAMSHEQLSRAINAGRQLAQRQKLSDTQLLIGKDITTGSTISATAIACTLLSMPAEQIISSYKELNKKEIRCKIKLIRQALTFHQKHLKSTLEILRRLGSFEIAAMTGCYLSCAHMGLPVLIDSFSSFVAALIAEQLCPGAKHWFLFSDRLEDQRHTILSSQDLLNLKTDTTVSITSFNTTNFPQFLNDSSLKKTYAAR